MARRRLALAACALVGTSGAAACGPPPPEAPLALVDHARWALAPAGEDPFAHEVDDASRACDDVSWQIEPPVLEVSTAACDHATLVQPALAPARAGDLVHVLAWHVSLTAPEPARGHMAVALGEQVVWEYEVDIPAEEAVLRPFVELEAEVAAGTPVYFHVHNHGDNDWKLLEVTTGPRAVYPDATGE